MSAAELAGMLRLIILALTALADELIDEPNLDTIAKAEAAIVAYL